ncbi:MAG: hypothetical protein P8Y93_13530 [Acidobacteriota bacterium]
MDATKVRFRRFREGDEGAVLHALREHGAARSLDEWAWKFPPEAGGRAICVGERDGEIVTVCAGVPATLEIDEREHRGLRLVDILTPISAPGLLESAMRAFAKEFCAADRFSIFLRFPSDDEAAGTGGLGPDQSVGVPFVCLRRRGPVRSSSRRHLYRAEPARDWEPRLDELWRRVRHRYPAAVVRDADYALRRFAGHPSSPYRRLLVLPRFSSRAVAFAVFRLDGGSCRWADLVWDDHHPGALDRLGRISSGLAEGGNEDIWIAGDPVARARFESLGFAEPARSTCSALALRSCDEKIDASRLICRLYLTMADTDEV